MMSKWIVTIEDGLSYALGQIHVKNLKVFSSKGTSDSDSDDEPPKDDRPNLTKIFSKRVRDAIGDLPHKERLSFLSACDDELTTIRTRMRQEFNSPDVKYLLFQFYLVHQLAQKQIRKLIRAQLPEDDAWHLAQLVNDISDQTHMHFWTIESLL